MSERFLEAEKDMWNETRGRYELDAQGRRVYIVTVVDYGTEKEWVVCPECDVPNPQTPCGGCTTLHHESCMEWVDVNKLVDPHGEREVKADSKHLCSSCKEDLTDGE